MMESEEAGGRAHREEARCSASFSLSGAPHISWSRALRLSSLLTLVRERRRSSSPRASATGCMWSRASWWSARCRYLVSTSLVLRDANGDGTALCSGYSRVTGEWQTLRPAETALCCSHWGSRCRTAPPLTVAGDRSYRREGVSLLPARTVSGRASERNAARTPEQLAGHASSGSRYCSLSKS